MKTLHRGYIAGPLVTALWTVTIVITAAVALSLATGIATRPSTLISLVAGAAIGLCLPLFGRHNLVSPGNSGSVCRAHRPRGRPHQFR